MAATGRCKLGGAPRPLAIVGDAELYDAIDVESGLEIRLKQIRPSETPRHDKQHNDSSDLSAPGPAAQAALAHPSRARIADELSDSPDGLALAEVATRLGLSQSAVREHLKTMAATGLVAAERAPVHGRGGPRCATGWCRPRSRRCARRGRSSACWWGSWLTPTWTPGRAAAAGRAAALERGQAGGGAPGIVAELAALGFAPREVSNEADARRGRLDLRLGSCPFREAVAAPGGGLVCQIHRGMAEGMAEEPAPGARLTQFVPQDPARAGCRVVVDGLPTPTGPGTTGAAT